MKYSYKNIYQGTFKEAVEETKQNLLSGGFGVLVEIDVKKTLKSKIDKDIDNYVILGACKPNLAYQAIQSEKDVGLFLPCNLIVYESDGNVNIATIKPTTAMSVIDNSELEGIAQQVEQLLIKVVDDVCK